MRTLAHCRERGLALFAYCPTCDLRAPPADICRAFDAWKVEELERAGVIACRTCGRSGLGVAIMADWWGQKIDVEVWNGAYGSMRRGLKGLSG